MNKRFKVVSVGEVLWDVFPDGAKFGGAPANVACHCAALANQACMVSCVGDDYHGRNALNFLLERKVDIDGITVSGQYPTGTVNISVDDHGKPEYVIGSEVAWDNIEWNAAMADIMSDADAVSFGTLAQRSDISRHAIEKLIEASPASCLKVFDVNLRLNFYSDEILRNSVIKADVLKLNDEELPVVGEVFGLSGDAETVLKSFVEIGNLRLAAMTRGSNGALLISRDGQSDYPGVKIDKVVDTVGAGDAFTAMLITGLLRGKTLDEINRDACRIAAYVCSQPGATPELPEIIVA